MPKIYYFVSIIVSELMNLEEVELFRRWKLKNIFAKLSPHFFPIRQIISEKAKLAMRNLL